MSRVARAAVFTGAGQPLQLRTFDVPEPEGGDVLIRVTGCTLCGSDLHTYTGRRSAPVPSILGHEILGRIEALGPAAPRHDEAGQELRPGDRVTWSIMASCGRCLFCERGLPQKCTRLRKYGHESLESGRALSGGLAEYCMLAPGTSILRLADDLTDDRVCPANCATATVAAALRTAGELRDRTVLIQGAGMLGLTACAMARAAGASAVVCCDLNAARLERAEQFGATHLTPPAAAGEVVSRITAGHGVDVAVELSGSPAAFEDGLRLIRTGAIYVLVGAVFPSRPVALELEQLVRRHLTIHGIHNYTPRDLLAAVRFLSEGRRYPFESLVSRWLPLADVEQAFQAAQSPGVFRLGIRL